MTYTQIADIRNGVIIQGFYMVRNSSLRASTKNSSFYADYTLFDGSGEINAKQWDMQEGSEIPKTGQVVKVQAQASEYQGRLQLKIERIRIATEDDPVDLGALVPSAPEAPATMLSKLEKYAALIKDDEIRELVQYLLEQNNEKLCTWPAALRNHHAVRSGLLYHTSTMLDMCAAMLKVYPYLQADLLYAGVILHDIAKVEELNVGNTGIATDYSTEGQLLGHITLGILMLDRAACELGIEGEKVTLLQHMLLSHHYEPEYGSPKYPLFAEAEALHFLDILDARMYDFKKLREETPQGTFSERQFSLNNRQIYNPAAPGEGPHERK